MISGFGFSSTNDVTSVVEMEVLQQTISGTVVSDTSFWSQYLKPVDAFTSNYSKSDTNEV